MSDTGKQGRLVLFFTKTLWELEPETYGDGRGRLVRYLQILALVVKDFWDDHCLLRASALSFSTILSLVPFFALTFAVLKGLGVQNRLEPLILDQVAAGSEEIVDRIVTYINNTNMTSLGAVGLVTLLVTVVSLLGNIEETFNVIWGVHETRSLYRKFSDYLSVVIVGPILLFAATSITTTLQSQSFIKWLIGTSYFGNLLLICFHLAPYVSMSLALTSLYIFIPNTRVRFKSALIGGLLAGTSWQLAQWVYIHFQVGVSRYNAIYGTLAVLPVFMVWLYTSWLIVLFGVEMVYAHQNIKTFRREVRCPHLSHGLKELLVLAILQKVGAAFVAGTPPWTDERLAEELGVSTRLVRDLLAELVTSGYLAKIAGEPPVHQPARALEQVPLSVLFTAIRTSESSCAVPEFAGADALRSLLADLDSARDAALSGLTLNDLVRSALPGPGAGPA
jgi:membrane protein